jgi:hypothetical protein
MAARPVYIEWIDSHSFDDWEVLDSVRTDLPLIQTLGFLIKETKEAFAVALNVGPKDCSCIMIIPKTAVRRKRWIKI